MLKYIMYMIFMIPLFTLNWSFIQINLFLMSFIFMLEMGCFLNIETVGMGFGLDFLSFMLIFLSIWISSLMLISSKTIVESFFYKKFVLLLLILLFMLLLSFSTLNLFMFYLYFESSLIPTFFLILGWGYQSERIQAGIYLLFYTLISSLPLLMMIFYMMDKNLTLMLLISLIYNNSMNINIYMFMCMYMAFLVKLPMFLFHLWLPKAHVEAPVAGSMILAGILLKLGGYGIIRISMFIWKKILNYVIFVIVISLIGGVLISVNCLRQTDMKMLVAYSSVSHMGIMVGGMLTFSIWGLSSSLAMMLSHGLCSSGLFYLVNVAYERFGSRNLLIVKGMMNFIPKMTLWWFLFCSMNMAAPPSLNLLSEIGLINSLISYSWVTFISLMLMGFFAAGYSLYLFSYSQHGKNINGLYSFSSSSIREYLIVFLHWLPLNFLILYSEIFMLWL
uniref:NADH-ubiquinone oxidoreductase chain 4 n=1 Tax=Ectopsocopsis cryptomeriae TaxID=297975 RepID=A0A8K1ZFD8_9NEOP|nr:NADH dehydrogenase subunit 4 [Ectopsocopsis cryptomeriae]